MKMKTMKLCLATLAGVALTVISADAATIMTSDGFEGSLGNWTAANNITPLYSYTVGVNYATTGTGAARIPINTGSNPTLTLTESLELVTLEATYVTISFDFAFYLQNAGTRFFRVEYSSNGGSSWTLFTGGQIASNTALGTVDADGVRRGSATFTRNTGLTDDFKIRFWGKNDTSTAYIAYIDNVVITSDAVPEPSAALLASLGLLGLLRRRG